MKVYKRRLQKGSVIAELGPALIFLILFMLLPAINLLGLGVTYFACYTLNDLQLHQACLVSAEVARSPNGPVNGALQNWRTSGAPGDNRC